MPYMQRLTWDGIALHGGSLPGYPASHGCIRVPAGAPAITPESESTSGPLTPKWVKSKSPSSEKNTFPFYVALSVTFFRVTPASEHGQVSCVVSGTSEATGSSILCPVARAKV